MGSSIQLQNLFWLKQTLANSCATRYLLQSQEQCKNTTEHMLSTRFGTFLEALVHHVIAYHTWITYLQTIWFGLYPAMSQLID
jgi:hypothetical protein